MAVYLKPTPAADHELAVQKFWKGKAIHMVDHVLREQQRPHGQVLCSFENIPGWEEG